MSSQSNAPVLVTVIIGIVIVAGLVAYTYYTPSSSQTSLSKQNVGLQQQLSSVSQQNSNLNQQASSQNQQISNLNQQVSNLNQQVSNLNQQVSVLQSKTVQVVTISNTVEIVETTTSTTTSTVTSVTAVPEGTLVMVNSSYYNKTNTLTLQVQNTQNYIVYAQLQATVMCITRPGAIFYCPNPVGTYTSNVIQFAPDSTTKVSFILSNVDILSSGTMDQIQIYFEASTMQMSPTYTLQYP